MVERSTLLGVLSALGLATLAYISGALSAKFELPPYPQLLQVPLESLEVRVERWFRSDVETNFDERTERWRRLQGTVLHKPDETWGRYTLLSSTRGTRARLIDMEGNVLHKWRAPFWRVWEDPPHIDDPLSEDAIFWRRVEMMPNGDLLACYAAVGDTPYGYGLVRLDRNSEVVWRYAGRTHHDFDVADDGTVVALEHHFRDVRDEPIPGFPQYRREILVDRIVELGPDGERRRRISLVDALRDSPFESLLALHPGETVVDPEEKRWDPFHTNNVDVVSASFARHHDFAEPGQVLISMRTNDTIGLVDLDRERTTWAMRGFWNMQHDPDPLPNGRLVVFDNEGNEPPGGRSRIVEYDPETGGILWSYTGTPEEPFTSNESGSLQPLPNGNVLATSSEQKRLFEVNRDGELVWDYFPADGNPNLHSAVRYAEDEVEFLDETGDE